MAIISEGVGTFSAGWCRFKALPKKFLSKVVDVAKKAKKLGHEDPRRIIHSFKVGLALSLVSLFYYFDDPLYEGFGISAMWAVLTVVVVFEFSVGATLGKGVNRGIATFVAGSLAVGAHRLASFSGEKLEPMLLGLLVFFVAAVVTFARFFPRMKARYDYGLLIFILTFALVSVSGYRDDQVLFIARTRLSTILVGGATAVFICILICPVWAGSDLHNLVASNIEKLGTSLEGFGSEYSKTPDESKHMELLQGYRSVLNSKATEESLVNFAKWEPRHGWFRYRHPWEHYLTIGAITRQCAYQIEALNGFLCSDVQTPQEVQTKIQVLCTTMSSESGHALKEIASAIQSMTWSSAADTHFAKAKTAAEDLKSFWKTSLGEGTMLLEIIRDATVASLLLEVVTCTGNIIESARELAIVTHFRNACVAVSLEEIHVVHKKIVEPCPDVEGSSQVNTAE